MSTKCPCCGTKLESDDLFVDLETNTASRGSQTVQLRAGEANALYALHSVFPGGLSKESLNRRVSIRPIDAERSVLAKTYVSRLRRRLRPMNVQIETIRGAGYRLQLDEAPR